MVQLAILLVMHWVTGIYFTAPDMTGDIGDFVEATYNGNPYVSRVGSRDLKNRM